VSDVDRQELVEIPARDLVAGDTLLLPSGLERQVLRVEAFDELTGRDPGPRLRVIVIGYASEAYENRASAPKGVSSIRVDEQGLRPFRPDELVRVDRG
jgi:hypothetical protein